MGLTQVPGRFTANHGGATGREAHRLICIFSFCSSIARKVPKVFSGFWELMGKQN
jgi:hypothetical protein